MFISKKFVGFLKKTSHILCILNNKYVNIMFTQPSVMIYQLSITYGIASFGSF